MMKQDEGFAKIWEVRSSKAVVDSSSDDEEGSSNKLVLFAKDDADGDDYDPRSHGAVRVEEKKVKPIKRKKEVTTKKNKRTTKKNKKTTKKKQSLKDEGMLKDLKVFADSLVRELASAKETMFARMRDEMRVMVASESAKKTKTKKKVCANEKIGSSKLEMNNNVNLMNNHIPYMDSHSSTSSRVEFCKLMAASQKLAELKQQQLFGGFSSDYHKSWGLNGERRPFVAGFGLPAPLSQEMANGSSRSSLSFLTEKGAGVGLPAPLSGGMVNGSSRSSLPFLTEKGAMIRASSQPMVANSVNGSTWLAQ